MLSFLNCDFIYQFPEPMPLKKDADEFLESENGRRYEGGRRAEGLLLKLIKNGTLHDAPASDCGLAPVPTKAGEWKILVDGADNIESKRIYIANTILAKRRGICRRRKESNAVVAWVNGEYKVRQISVRESGRLMGASDEDIDKMIAANSNTQLYKQFGNSIVVDVMCAMFKQLGLDKKGEDNDAEGHLHERHL